MFIVQISSREDLTRSSEKSDASVSFGRVGSGDMLNGRTCIPPKELALGFRWTSNISFRSLTTTRLADGRGVIETILEGAIGGNTDTMYRRDGI